MPNKFVEDHFKKQDPKAYDDFNSKLDPISKNLHFLTRLILTDLPKDAKILCVGVGTGAEIFELAKVFEGWRFVGLDPSENMLEGCHKKLTEQNLTGRVDLFHGYLKDYDSKTKFDAVLCFYVMHFVRDLSERKQMYVDMLSHLKPDGKMINAEISFDTESVKYKEVMAMWLQMYRYAGSPEERVQKYPAEVEKQLLIFSPEKTEALIEEAGFNTAHRFFQSLLIQAWFAKKPG